MAYGLILAFPAGVGEAEYNAVNANLPFDVQAGVGFPDGLISHAAGMSDEGWVVSEVWETKEHQHAFMEGDLGKAFGIVQLPPPNRVYWYELVTNVHVH